MHVVFFLYLKRNFGGGDYSIYKFAEALAQQGHKIVIFYVGNSKVVEKDIHINLKIYNIIEIKLKKTGMINHAIEKIYDKFLLNRYLGKNSSNIDFIVGYQRNMAIKAMVYGEKYRIKTVNFIFETPNWLMEKWPKWKQIFLSNLELRESWDSYKNALVSSNLIIANSILTSTETVKWMNREPDLVLYPGISLPPLDLNKSQGKENQIIYIGRLEEGKNIHEIIEALALLKSDLKLVICGGGSLLFDLMDLSIKKNVIVEFKGKVSEYEKWDEINKSLFMVFPSSFEGFGMPPMEALSMRVPCICSDIPIFREVYSNNVVYFEEHNITELADKIKFLLSDREFLKLNGEIGYNFIHENFGWDKSAKKMEALLHEYINQIKPID